MSADRIYTLTHEANSKVQALKLHPIEWKLLLAISNEGLITGRFLCEKLHISPEGYEQITGKLKELGLIHEPELNLAEYGAYIQVGTSSAAASYVPAPSSASESSATAPSRPAQRVRFSLGRKKESAAAPAQAPSDDSKPASLELQSLLNFIRKHAGDGSLGQLAIYRLFLKVPKPLLESSGLSVVSLDNTNAKATDPVLIQALLKASKEITGKDYLSVVQNDSN